MPALRRIRLGGRLLREMARAVFDTDHPLMVQMVIVRRCNLRCGYCNQYDRVSEPVPLELMRARVDHLSRLRTSIVTFTGGEPLLHPDLDALITQVRERGMVATVITNGYLLSPERIRRLNEAGLDHLQISIDNLEPDEVSRKSLRLLEPKLRWLAEHARFEVNINSVLGGGTRSPEDALAIWQRAQELGFTRSLSLVNGQEAELARRPREMEVYRELRRRGDWTARLLHRRWQDPIAEGRPIDWKCRAGARYLYVDDHGLVHQCAQRRSAHALSLEAYGTEDLRRCFRTPKPCAPFCTLNCVQQSSLLDHWRPQGQAAPARPLAPERA